MKLLIIRHGDPDYSIDSLTEKGLREARLLSARLSDMKIDKFYVSPLGRAKDTASCTLDIVGKKAKICPWLREFAPLIRRPDLNGEKIIAWDWLPQDWMVEECYFTYDHWMETDIMKEGDVKDAYDWVCRELDQVLAAHGYIREGHSYKVQEANNDTLAFFCHFGVECVLLSHLLNVSPMILWHGTCAAPSSVTTVVTEERRKGIASFRMSSFADISHLYAGGEQPSFAARFCECFDNRDERHD